ncbi:hypothetical protein [Ferruginibacter sp.]
MPFMNRILATILICFLFTTASQAQGKQYDTLYHKMFFNVFLHKPDSSILGFVQTYFPQYAEDTTRHEWSLYPPGYMDTFPPVQKTEHNFLFTKHPFFNITCIQGKFEILATEVKGYLPRIEKPGIVFLFKNKTDAEKALNYFIQKFTAVSKIKTIKRTADRTTATFSDGDKGYSPMVFTLYKDELSENRYNVRFGF